MARESRARWWALPRGPSRSGTPTACRVGTQPARSRRWNSSFYPGSTVGEEFVYPKPRAMQLAKAAKAVVPAIAVDVADVNALKTAPIVAVTPDEKEIPSPPPFRRLL